MTKLEELLNNAHEALKGSNTCWPPSPQAVIDAFAEFTDDLSKRFSGIEKTQEMLGEATVWVRHDTD